MNFNILLFLIIGFGAITSYTDIKLRKIKNTHILLLLITGLLFNVFYSKTLTMFSLNPMEDFLQTIFNVFFALSVGFFLWLINLWSSGDAKLFVGFSLLLPVFIYKHGYISYLPSMVLLINTFVPITIFYLITAFTHMNLELIKKKLRETFNFSNFFNMAIYIFGFSYAVNFILNFLNIKLDMFSQIFVLFLLMEIIGKILPKSLNKLSGILSLFRLLFSLNSIFTLSFLWNYIISLFLFQITWLLISFLINYSFAENVKIKDLKPNMALGEKLIKVKNGFEKKEISSVMNIFSILRLVKEELTSSNSISITKLSENDIEVLKKLQKEKKLKFATLQIVKTTPFAPLLLIGVLITCLFEGNLFYYLLPLMSHLHI